MPSPSLARTRSPDQSPDQQPLALTDEQMSALLAAAHPLPPDSRSAFLDYVNRSRPSHGSRNSGDSAQPVQRGNRQGSLGSGQTAARRSGKFIPGEQVA